MIISVLEIKKQLMIVNKKITL